MLVGWVPAVVFNHYSPGREAELREHLAHWPGASALAISNGAGVVVHQGYRACSLLTASTAGEGALVLPCPDSEPVALVEQQPVLLRADPNCLN